MKIRDLTRALLAEGREPARSDAGDVRIEIEEQCGSNSAGLRRPTTGVPVTTTMAERSGFAYALVFSLGRIATWYLKPSPSAALSPAQ